MTPHFTAYLLKTSFYSNLKPLLFISYDHCLHLIISPIAVSSPSEELNMLDPVEEKLRTQIEEEKKRYYFCLKLLPSCGR